MRPGWSGKGWRSTKLAWLRRGVWMHGQATCRLGLPDIVVGSFCGMLAPLPWLTCHPWQYLKTEASPLQMAVSFGKPLESWQVQDECELSHTQNLAVLAEQAECGHVRLPTSWQLCDSRYSPPRSLVAALFLKDAGNFYRA